MPYATRPTGKGHVKQVNKETGRMIAKNTTPAKAAAQVRAIHANQHKGGKK